MKIHAPGIALRIAREQARLRRPLTRAEKLARYQFTPGVSGTGARAGKIRSWFKTQAVRQNAKRPRPRARRTE
jgi:hypothetical protein